MADENAELEALARSLASPPRLGPLIVEWAPTQWLGLPWWAALTFRAASADDALLDLGEPDVYDHHDLLGLRLVRVLGGDAVLDVAGSPQHGDHACYAKFDLDFGDSHRVLVDLSPLLGPVVGPDSYAVEVRYDGGFEDSHKTTSAPALVTLASADHVTLGLRAQLAEVLRDLGSWAAVFDELAERGEAQRFLEGVAPGAHPFAWPALRAVADRTPDVFEKLPSTAFDGYPHAIEPHSRLLFIEWLMEQRQIDRARHFAIDLRNRAFGLHHQIEALGLNLPPLR